MQSKQSESPCKECSESSDDLDEEDLEYGSEQEFGDDDDDEVKVQNVFRYRFAKIDI
jgi:hypothetical protein